MFLRELSEYSLQGLRVFVYVASMGSVAEAAAALGLTQPAVSLQINNLEKHIGFPLFERQGRKNVLTVQGRDLFQKLQPHLEQLEQILVDARDHEHVSRPKLFVGSVEGIGEYWLGRRFLEFRKKCPEVRLFLELADTPELEARLLTGQLSLLISPRELDHAQLVTQVLMDERFVPVGRKKAIKELQEALDNRRDGERFWEAMSWIGYGTSLSVEGWATKWLEHVGIHVDRRLKYRHVVNSYVVAKQLLLDGAGVCVAPAHTVADELASRELVGLETRRYPALRNRLYICHREGSLTQAHISFIEYLLKSAASF